MSRFALPALAFALFAASPALADRDATPEEAQKIGTALKAAGYVSWEEIELDDDGPYWDVDDARKADGTKWDLKLRPNTLGVLRAERDD